MALRRPIRLPGFTYVGKYAYSITICTHKRIRAFEDRSFARDAVARLLRTARKFGFAIDAYCLMPDHVHLVLIGERDDSSLESFVKSWNTQTGHAWRQKHGNRLWQHGYYDRILRTDEGPVFAARYVALNPVRAGLVKDPADYEFTGSMRYTVKELIEIF